MTHCDGRIRRRSPRGSQRFENRKQLSRSWYTGYIFSLQGPGAVVETGKKGKAGAKKGGKVEE